MMVNAEISVVTEAWYLEAPMSVRERFSADDKSPTHSTSAVIGQLSKRRDVRSGPVSRVWNFTSHNGGPYISVLSFRGVA
jgi:hypothetical protein